MDGKNVFDFVDPDIMEKLEKLEEEEEAIRNQIDVDQENDNLSELSEDLLQAHEEVMENKKLIRQKHKLVTGSQLPRRVRDLTATERLMENIRTDKQEGNAQLKTMSHKKRTKEKDRLKKNLIKETVIDEDEEEENDMMDVEGEISMSRSKKKQLTPEQQTELKKREKNDAQKQAVVERMKRKIQKKWSRGSRVNEADRMINCKKPKHLNSGKRGIGKTDRR